MTKTNKATTVAQRKAVLRQELRRSNAAVPHRTGKEKEMAQHKKHKGRMYDEKN